MEKETKQEIEQWKKVGQIGAQVMAYAKKIIKPEMPLLELAEKIEEKLKALKAASSFPVNLSIDEIAAHSTPAYNSEAIARGLLKIDLGANINGFISDMACSVDLTPEQKHTDLINASRFALNEAIKVIKPGISFAEIGKIIQTVISTYNFASVRNLSGHELKQWHLHAGSNVPNYDNGNMSRVEEGMILAIEPFATYGEGIVQSGSPSGIYSFKSHQPVRDLNARKILEFIESEYKELPFSARWLVKKFDTRALFSLRLLEQANALHQFKHLVEKSKQAVSQAEHTILITANGCEVLTKE